MTGSLLQPGPPSGPSQPEGGPGEPSHARRPRRWSRSAPDGSHGAAGRRRRWLGLGLLGFLLLGTVLVVVAVPSRGPGAHDSGTSAPPPRTQGTDRLDQQVQALQRRLRIQPDDHVGWATLGIDYVQQAKNIANPAFYPKAEGALQRSLQLDDTDNFVAMTGMANLRSAQHRFGEALTWAQRAVEMNPYHAPAFGALADAYTQLGRYDDAAEAVQRMVDLRPGTPSLSRASYVWELRGDLNRARALMQRALDDATSPADQAFAHYYLGEIAASGGDHEQALAQNEAGLRADPGYPDLLEGKAKAEAALGRRDAAVQDWTSLVDRAPQPQYLLEAGQYLQSIGMTVQAQRQDALFAAEVQLFQSNGVLLDVEPSLFYADHGDPAAALRAAEAGIAARPFLEMDDAYAWALHAGQRDAEALVWSDRALASGVRNALFLYHRGMIEKALGRAVAARDDLSQALALDPKFNPVHAPLARQALDELGGHG